MRRLFYALAGLAFIAFASCNLNYKTTKSGIKYKIYSGKASAADTTGVALKVGDIVKFNFKYVIPGSNGKDSVLKNTYDGMPAMAKIDTGEMTKFSIMEIIPLMKAGDSAMAIIPVDSILKMMPMGAPPFFKKGDKLKAYISVLNVYKDEAAARADAEKEQAKEKVKEDAKNKAAAAKLDEYIKSNGIKATKTANGVYVVLTNPGDISLKADSGMTASVLYTGHVVGENKIFDTNIDSTSDKYHKGTIDINVGQHSVIPGWDEALRLFGKGGSGKIYIPSGEAYGAQESPAFPAYSNLEFDIQVVDVKKSEPAKTQPQQQMTPEMQKQIQEQLQKQMQQNKGK